MNCGRCKKPIPDDKEEDCWWCMGPLCSACWDEVGNCGHPEADAIEAAARKVEQPE